MATIQVLREEHAHLVRIVGQLAECISRPAPPPATELFGVRRELNATLIGHLKAEDWILYPMLLTSDDPTTAATARQFLDEMGGLAAAFLAYADKWSASAIESDWDAYCTESKGIIEALTQRIIRENRELYPLAEREKRAA
jgi:iron-sulfur cluster repair protein YtfE (RIC family)